ncbi:hypothetical protein SNEBB_002945 [Seison nebaliae]|nr:hypothetical protein SNEBB_002945 [Seison nebaliae]
MRSIDQYCCLTNGTLCFQTPTPPNLRTTTKQEIKKYFIDSFQRYTSLFWSVNKDQYFYIHPDRLRLPLVFYYGHTAAVYMNKMTIANLMNGNERINRTYDAMMETGVDEMSWDSVDTSRMGDKFQWPSMENVCEYREKIFNFVLKVIDRTPLQLPITKDSAWWSVLMGVEHENIHFETSSVLLRQMPIEYVSKPPLWNYGPFDYEKAKVENELVEIDGGNVKYGKSESYPTFGFDNEYGIVEEKITRFSVSKFKVTNEEFLEFMKDGGYENQKLWKDEGWKWKEYCKVTHPTFWVSDDTNKEFPYKFRLMFDEVDMPRNWPVEVNYHEANAFCRWKGEEYRMISESEHQLMRNEYEEDFLSDKSASNANVSLRYGSSTPVNLNEPNGKNIYDLFGNVWEWTEDHYNALPHSQKDHQMKFSSTNLYYDDFSTPCYDGRHNIILGSSWASIGSSVGSIFGRYMFRRHFFQHCGFRYAKSTRVSDELPYNGIKLISHYLSNLTSFSEDIDHLSKISRLTIQPSGNEQFRIEANPDVVHEILINEYWKMSSIVQESFKQIESIVGNVKDIDRELIMIVGCGGGKLCQTFSNSFQKVLGLDCYEQCINYSKLLVKHHEIRISISDLLKDKYDLKDNILILPNNLSTNNKNIKYQQLTWLPLELPISDIIIMTQLHRVHNPKAWLLRMNELSKKYVYFIVYGEKKESIGKLLEDSEQFKFKWNILLQVNSFTIYQWIKVEI